MISGLTSTNLKGNLLEQGSTRSWPTLKMSSKLRLKRKVVTTQVQCGEDGDSESGEEEEEHDGGEDGGEEEDLGEEGGQGGD